MPPKISVIMPSYNYAHMMEAAVNSVLNQTLSDLELIIIDDGSTDNTGDIALKAASRDSRIKYVKKENRGLSAARNRGIAESSGQYIAFIDPDDLWMQMKLDLQSKLLDENPEASLCYCRAEFIGENGEILKNVNWPRPENPKWSDLLYINYIEGSGSSVMTRKSALESSGMFDENLRGLEDMDMWLRLLHDGKAVCAEQTLVRIRRHAKSMQAGKIPDMAKRELEYIKYIEKSIANFPELSAMRSEAMSGVMEGLCYTSYVNGRLLDAMRYFIRASMMRPLFLISAPIRFAISVFRRMIK